MLGKCLRSPGVMGVEPSWSLCGKEVRVGHSRCGCDGVSVLVCFHLHIDQHTLPPLLLAPPGPVPLPLPVLPFFLSFPLSLPSLLASSLPVSPPPLPKSPFPGFSIRGALWVSFFLRLLFLSFLKESKAELAVSPEGAQLSISDVQGRGGAGENLHTAQQGPRSPECSSPTVPPILIRIYHTAPLLHFSPIF